MALSIAFFALAVTFASIGTNYLNKAKQMPVTTDTELAAKKKTHNTGMLHFISGVLFFSAGIIRVM